MATTVVQFRVEESLKNEATELFESLGLDLPTAFRVFLKKCVATQGIPFKMKTSSKNSKMVRLMKEISQKAEQDGISDMSIDEINEEIALYRAGQ